MTNYNTKQRRTLLDHLAEHADESFSARGLAEAIGDKDISVSAVYRNLAQLEKQGGVRRINQIGSREAYYQYSNAAKCRKHLHLACARCGRTFHMDVASTDELIRAVSGKTGFEVDRSSTVLYGICEKCRGKQEE